MVTVTKPVSSLGYGNGGKIKTNNVAVTDTGIVTLTN